MARIGPRILEFDVEVDRARAATSGPGGSAIARDEAWHAEHLMLAALVRCVLTSLDYHARRRGVALDASGSAHGVVTKRQSDGRYAFVEIDERLEVELAGPTGPNDIRALLDKAERDCFVGNSLMPRPRYHWVVNGTEVE